MTFDGNFALDRATAGLFNMAAKGDHEAQRWLAGQQLRIHDEAVRSGGAPDLAAYEGLYWSRLAAAHGDELDAMRLSAALGYAAHALGQSGRRGLAQHLTAEAVAIIQALADTGYEPAASAVDAVIADMSEPVLRMARKIVEDANVAPRPQP